jgi:hypothetical protein
MSEGVELSGYAALTRPTTLIISVAVFILAHWPTSASEE